jgi:hypothetical protein
MPEATRHRRAGTRISLAVALLGVAGFVLVVALIVASATVLLVAAVTSYVAGVAASRMLADELAQVRRDAARARADQALVDTQRSQAVARQHRLAVTTLSRRLADSHAAATALRIQLALAQEQVTDTSRRLVRESRRSSTRMAALQAEVDRLHHELAVLAPDDMLATWDGVEDVSSAPDADHAGVVDLMTWEQRATPPSGRRRHA